MLTFRVVNSPRVLSTGLTLLALLVVLAVVVRDPLPGETALLRAVHAEDGSGAQRSWQAVSDASDALPLALVAVVGLAVLLALRRVRSAGLLLAAVAVPLTVNPVLKDLLGRDRPDLWSLGEVSAHSMPAGHAANSMAVVAGVVAVLIPRTARRGRAVSLAVATLVLLVIGAAQLALGRHYPSDLVVGWLWAAAWVSLVVSLPFGASRDPAGAGTRDVSR